MVISLQQYVDIFKNAISKPTYESVKNSSVQNLASYKPKPAPVMIHPATAPVHQTTPATPQPGAKPVSLVQPPAQPQVTIQGGAEYNPKTGFTTDAINQAYQAVLGRAADPEGIRHYQTVSELGALGSAPTLDALKQDLMNSQEYKDQQAAQGGTAATDTTGATTDPAAASGGPLDTPEITAAKQGITDMQTQLQSLTTEIQGYKDSKRAEIVRSGGIVDEAQLDQQVAEETKPLLLQQNTLSNELRTATQNYNTLVSETKYTASYEASQAKTSETAARTELTALMTKMGSGELDLTKIDPTQLASLEQESGYPAGTLEAIIAKMQSVHLVTDNAGNTTFVGLGKDNQVQVIATPVKGKAKTTGTGGKLLTAQQANAQIAPLMDAATGKNSGVNQDNYVSPTTYNYYKQQWTTNGLTGASFDTNYSKYVHPKQKGYNIG